MRIPPRPKVEPAPRPPKAPPARKTFAEREALRKAHARAVALKLLAKARRLSA
jgi:hypothetical protein